MYITALLQASGKYQGQPYWNGPHTYPQDADGLVLPFNHPLNLVQRNITANFLTQIEPPFLKNYTNITATERHARPQDVDSLV